MTGGINIGVVGLGFGQDFLPIYLDHPDVADVAVVELLADADASTAGAAKHLGCVGRRPPQSCPAKPTPVDHAAAHDAASTRPRSAISSRSSRSIRTRPATLW